MAHPYYENTYKLSNCSTAPSWCSQTWQTFVSLLWHCVLTNVTIRDKYTSYITLFVIKLNYPRISWVAALRVLYLSVLYSPCSSVCYSSNFWNFSLRPVDGFEQYAPGVMWAWPFCAHIQTESPILPRSSQNTVSSLIHSCFRILIFVVDLNVSQVCVCVHPFQSFCLWFVTRTMHNQTLSKGEREKISKNGRRMREGETDILIHLVQSQDLPPTTPHPAIHSDSNRSVK